MLKHSIEVLNTVRNKTDRVILFYSAGKDSIVCLDLLSKHFKEVVCVVMYLVKDLEHVNRFLEFSTAKYPNVKMLQVPHWNLTYLLRSGYFCVPQPKLKLMKLVDIDNSIRLQTGINWSCFGMKQADGMNRRIMLKTYDNQAISEKTGKFYPLSKWNKAAVLSYIKQNKLPTPVQYGSKASNGVSFDINVFLYLQKHYPGDLKKIFEVFPYSEHILFEHEQREKQNRPSIFGK